MISDSNKLRAKRLGVLFCDVSDDTVFSNILDILEDHCKSSQSLKQFLAKDQNFREMGVEDIFKNFWSHIVVDSKTGEIDMEQVKKELADYAIVLNEVPKVYCEITNNNLSKPLYRAEDVVAEFREHFESKEIIQDDIKSMIESIEDIKDLKQELVDYFQIKIDKIE